MTKLFARRAFWVLLTVPLIPISYFYLLSFMAAKPDHLGVNDGRLAPCAASPNCVSTQADDDLHRIAPLSFRGSAANAVQRLKAVLARQTRMKIVAERENYLHVEATSLIFRFVDDVEFYVDETAGAIQFRSASRVGYSDLGANRARMERIRAAWEKENP